MINKYAIKKAISGKDIKNFRKKYSLNKNDLASLLNVSSRTIEGWESSESKISGPIVLLFRLLNENPELIDKLIVPEMKYGLRLYYMQNGDINTVIDVDMINRKVFFKNYTSNIILRAFGNKESVTYEEYEKFLESRCFPSNRDKLKIELNKLDIPYYDPLLIIEKTKGRMADDDLYIEIVRGKEWLN